MKFFILLVLVTIAGSEASNDKQTSKPPPSEPYNLLPAHESSSPMPYNFGYEVKGDDYTSFGDTRVGDRQGKVSGTYHVQLPDGRHQHVTYKDEGKGFIADVKYEGESRYNTSKPVEYKELADDYGTSHNSAEDGLSYVEPSNKELSYENSVKDDQLNDLENEKSKSNERADTEPQVYNFPTVLFYEEVSSTTSSYKDYEYTRSSETPAYTTQAPYTTKTYSSGTKIPIPSSTSFWKPIPVSSKPVYTTTDYKAPSTFTTPASKTPSTTPDYNKPIYYTESYKKTIATKAYKIPATTSVYKAPAPTSPAYKTPYPSTPKPKASNPVTTTAYKKPIYFGPVYKTTVATTPDPKHDKNHPYTPKAYKAASYQILPLKPFAAYKPHSNKVPVITRVAPYTAPVYKTPIYVAPGYKTVSPNKVTTYKPGKVSKHSNVQGTAVQHF